MYLLAGTINLNRGISGMPRMKPTEQSCSFDYRKLPLSGVVPCTLLLLRAASGGPGLLAPPRARSNIEATHTDVPKKHQIPSHPKHPRLKKQFFSPRNPMYLLPAAMNTSGDISGMPSMQATQHPRTSPPGLRASECDGTALEGR